MTLTLTIEYPIDHKTNGCYSAEVTLINSVLHISGDTSGNKKLIDDVIQAYNDGGEESVKEIKYHGSTIKFKLLPFSFVK